MRIGITLGARDDAREMLRQAQSAEAAGLDYVACGEHLFFHGPVSNGLISLAAVAGATERIRLLSAVTLLPMYPAALAAKMVATLDQISGGRFDFGVGVGGEYPPEFEAVGVPVKTRGRRMDEALDVITRLFGGEAVTHESPHANLQDLRLQPQPLQGDRLPIWMGGRRDVAIRRAGKYTDVWMPYMITPERLESSLAAVRAAAVEAGRDPHSVRGAVYAWGNVDADAAWARRTGIEMVSAAYAQDFAPLADKYLVLGDVPGVLARVKEYADAGAETLIFSPAARGDERDRVVRTFQDEVAPALQDSAA